MVEDRETHDDNDVFIQWNGYGDRNLGNPAINRMVSAPWRSVVTGDRWKLNLSHADQSELYDLNTDPHEMHTPLRRPRSTRPHPRHDRPHQDLDARRGRHHTAAVGVAGHLTRY